jgi:hypothetical protein
MVIGAPLEFRQAHVEVIEVALDLFTAPLYAIKTSVHHGAELRVQCHIRGDAEHHGSEGNDFRESHFAALRLPGAAAAELPRMPSATA